MSDDHYSVLENAANQEAEAIETAEGLPPFDKEEFAARKQAERDETYALLDKATERVKDDPSSFRSYLDMMARLPRMSVANTLLIFQQMPEATRLGDFDYWKNVGVSVRKGATALMILVQGDDYTRPDGSIGTSYNVKKVFDVSQTTSRHIEPRFPDIQDALYALVDKAPVSIKAVQAFETETQKSHFDPETNTISVKEGLTPEGLFKVLAKELAHADLLANGTVENPNLTQEYAKLSGYVVSKRHGIETPEVMPVYVPSKDDETLQDVRNDLKRIRGTAKDISDRMDVTMEATKAKVQEAAPAQKSARVSNDAR